MATTVIINRWTGASGTPTKTNITSANTVAQTDDAHTAVAASSQPIVKPGTGTNQSFWVSTRLEITAIDAGLTLSNIRWYTDGTNNFGTGVTCNGQDATTYVQATGTVGTTGTVLNTTNHTGLTAAPVDVFTFTSASPKSITGSCTTTGDCGNFFVYQIVVATTAAAGVTPQETFTWLYDLA